MRNADVRNLKTWIEINSAAARKNYETFRKAIGPKVKLWAVVKSNAYGHGLTAFGKLADKIGVDGFCVDSAAEGLTLRREGITRPILALGPTLPAVLADAAAKDITVSVSNFEILKNLLEMKNPPKFHLKIDTGMHRQGFFVVDIPAVIRKISNFPARLRLTEGKSGGQFLISKKLTGVFTHFASAKDINYPTYTDMQFTEFQKACGFLEKAGYKDLTRHCAATGGTLLNPKYHLDAVRIGIGLYGLWPSKELDVQLRGAKTDLRPILSWHTIISEIKQLKAGDYIGYDLAEKVELPTKMAILPIGYWHGFPRVLSGIGEALINGKLARVLGRVSMDLIAVDVTGIPCRQFAEAILIADKSESSLGAFRVAQKAGLIHYELLTRLNPLIQRVIV